jgi:protein CpxP
LLELRVKVLTRFAVLAAVGALAVSAGASQAQSPPSQGYGQQQPDLHALLHIRPDQEAAFQAYQSARPTPLEMQALRPNPQQLAAMTTPQRLDRINAVLNTQLTVFHRQADAARALYMILSPDQKRTFDQVTGPGQGRGAPPQR